MNIRSIIARFAGGPNKVRLQTESSFVSGQTFSDYLEAIYKESLQVQEARDAL